MFSNLGRFLDSFGVSRSWKKRRFNPFTSFWHRSHRTRQRLAKSGLNLDLLSAAETLEQRRLLAVDVSLTGQVLTVAFDDASADSVNLSITPTGYESTGSNISSGTGTISQLVVQDAGTAEYSDFFLMEANQIGRASCRERV